MIVFDGISLNSVANVKIEDIRISPVKLNPVARPRAIRGGSDFVRMRDGERTVTITFAVQDMNKVTRQAALTNISQWAKSDKEYKLELPTEPNKYLMCVCTAKPEPSTRQWWESKLRLVFTCFDDPYWISKGQKIVSCGTPFTVLGDAPPLMTIQRNWFASAYDISYTLDNNTISLSQVVSGNMVIDLNRQTIAIAGNSVMQYYNPTGRFLIPKTGTQTISGTGTVLYRERWE